VVVRALVASYRGIVRKVEVWYVFQRR
jgi:hypothetical protein